MRAGLKPLQGDAWLAPAGFAAFSALFLVQLSLHHPWRDEAQAWLIATQAESFFDLLVIRHEGHPPLWHWLLFIVSRFGSDLVLLKATAGAIGLASLALIWCARDVRTVDKALVSASYYVSFQYTVVARSYGLALLLLLIVATRRDQVERHPLLAAAAIGLAALTHIYFTLAAPVLLAYVIYTSRPERRQVVAMAALCGILVAYGLWSMIESVQSSTVLGRLEGIASRDYALHQLVRLIVEPFATHLPAIVGLAVLPLLVLAFWRGRAEAGAFAAAALLVIAFQLTIYGRALQHIGAVFVLFLFFYFLRPRAFLRPAAVALLAVAAIAGVAQFGRNLAQPWGAGLGAAAMIRAQGLASADWIAYPDFVGTVVAAELNRPIYSLECRCEAWAIPWEARDRLGGDAIADRVEARLAQQGADQVHAMVSIRRADAFRRALAGRFRIETLGKTEASQMKGGSVWLLRISRR